MIGGHTKWNSVQGRLPAAEADGTKQIVEFIEQEKPVNGTGDLRQILRGDQLINRAAGFHRKGELAAAEGLYLQALNLQSDQFDALHSLGFLRYQQGRFTEALSLIGAALKANPNFPPALVNYAVVLQALNRPAEALARYDTVLAMRPDKVEALCSRGNALRDYYRDRPLRDLKYNVYDKALAIPPRAPDIFNYRGIALKDLDRPAEALASFERALAMQPEHVEALKNRDNLLREQEHRAEALASRDDPPKRNPMSQQYPGGLPVRATYGHGYQSTPPVSARQPSTIEKHEMALAVARAFEPKQVVGFGKIHLGRDFDGGYVMVDDFAGVLAALSCGISDDATWDLEIAKRNIPVHQFDHTIEKGPIDHPLLTFNRRRIAAADAPGTLCLDSMAQQFLPDRGRAILKIDIEGDEWQAFSTVSAKTLDRFSQIICEFHGLYYAAHPMWHKRFVAVLSKLRALFEVVHVHGNNAGPFANIANVILPCVLEVTLASRSCYQFEESNEIFPTPLDQPNLPSQPEMRLGSFRF